ncbi:MAG: hypothetical protein L0229_20225 [Blastocatellia bacterium]|nr:hypothetical protein [Blastocatellia bacterium]
MEEITYTCRGPRVSEDSAERAGCGLDITELVQAVEVDGETHEIECPRCGNVATVTRTPED